MSDATATPQPGALDLLWAEACRWADLLPQIFGEPDVLASVGLSRRLALRCCNWLWSIEGMVRRLIIAAALVLDPGKLPGLRLRTPGPTDSTLVSGHSRPPRFRLFAFTGSADRKARRPGADMPPSYAHAPFPADDLLRLGPRRRIDAIEIGAVSSPARETPPRRLNPLHRRGRVSRWDPDYCGQKNETSARSHAPRTTSRSRAVPVSSLHRLPTSTEWRRVEEEWERVLPAPLLAARITALFRIIDRPARWIRRLARRLHKSNLAARLAAQPPPRSRRPKLDQTQPAPLQDELVQAHALLRRDTS